MKNSIAKSVGLLALVLTAASCLYLAYCQYQAKKRWEVVGLITEREVETRSRQPWDYAMPDRERLWFGGAMAPRGFNHGTAWVTGYETEGREILTFAVEEPVPMVYVDVDKDDILDGVYPGQKREGFFPAIKKGSKPVRPAEADHVSYRQLLTKMRQQ